MSEKDEVGRPGHVAPVRGDELHRDAPGTVATRPSEVKTTVDARGDDNDDEDELRRRLVSEYELALANVSNVVTAALAPSASRSRQARLREEVLRLTERLTRVAERPDEPIGDAVRFTKRFQGGDPFTYVAVRAPDGRWYVTGNVTKSFRWDDLLDFVTSAGDSLTTLDVVTGWRSLVKRDES